MDIKFALTLVASLGALVFSFLSYRRNRKFENENYIYKSKIEIYSKILAELNMLLNGLQDNMDLAKTHLNNPTKESAEIIHQKADDVDDLCYAFQDFIVINSLIIPQNIMNEIDRFCDKILDSESMDSENTNIAGVIEKMESHIDDFIKDADKINILLRKDLHIDQLNLSLYRRLR